MKQVRMGIIGFGVQGGSYAGFISQGKVEGMVLGGICDIDPEKKEKAAKEYPEVPFFEDYMDMIGSGGSGLCHHHSTPLSPSRHRDGRH